MVQSETDNEKGTAPPKPVRRVWTVGSIPNTDEKFLEWCGYQTQKRGPLEMMKLPDLQLINVASFSQQISPKLFVPFLRVLDLNLVNTDGL